MTRARDIANLVDSNGDIVAGALGNVPPSNDASALTTGTLDIARISNGAITAAKLDPSAIANAGTIAYFSMSTAPTGWIKANGAAVSRTTYSDLFTAIGTTYGSGDGSTTFNIPDLRGEFPRGWDDGRGVDSGRSFGSAQSDSLQNITGTVLDTSAGTSVGLHGGGGSGAFTVPSQSPASTYRQALEIGNGGKISFDASRVARTSSETRGRNIALLACIKY